MDKLRALQYFVVASEERSFAAAARRLGVTATAVTKLVSSLERALGARLFERGAGGISLTAVGAGYRDACVPALAGLAEADELTRETTQHVAGRLVVGAQHVVARGALAAALPRWHACHPDVHIDLREFSRLTREQTHGVDVFLVLGSPRADDFVQRRATTGRFVVAASPAYWATRGRPAHPRDLQEHVCLPIRSLDGRVMDVWNFARADEKVSVPVKGWLTAGNTHRDTVLDLALGGHGVVRLLDWTDRAAFVSGRLDRALPDWFCTDAPAVNLLYRSSAARLPRVRLFVDFVHELFREIEAGIDFPAPNVRAGKPARTEPAAQETDA